MTKAIGFLTLAVAALSLAACGGGKTSSTPAGGAAALHGAGSTFVDPLVESWRAPYESAHGVRIDYNPVGSGGGIDAITNRSVDFGASDAPLTPDQLSACKGCIQLPWALSATSIAYRLDGAPAHLRISGPVLAQIFLGKITKWNDSALAALNRGVALPDIPITPVFRSDSSGTSFNFTDYLSHVSPGWDSKVGRGTQVNFPAGTGGKGSSGVSAVMTRTNGAIGYVDVAYATTNHLSYFAVENARGDFFLPTLKSIGAAASTVHAVPPDGAISIVDADAAAAYPICTFTYVILPTKTTKADALKAFVRWAVTSGQQYGPKLLFEPLPQFVRSADQRSLAQVKS